MKIKNALIVGGTSGIGLGIATALSLRGINTHIIGRRLFAGNSAAHSCLKLIQVDLTESKAIEYIQNHLAEIKLDYIVFSGATEMPLKIFSEITVQEYDYAFALNVKAPFLLTKALLPNLNSKARLLFLTSRLSISPEAGSLIYSMTKSALETFSAGLNKELNGVLLSSSIIPGVVDTEMQERLREADPLAFPKASFYREMLPKLQTVKDVSDSLISHLCDTDDNVFATQRVNVANKKIAAHV